MPNLTPPRESDIQRSILTTLRALGIPAWRQNSGAFKLEGTRWFRAGIKGIADIQACLPPHGKLLVIEVKRPGEKPTLHQTAFLNAIPRAGGIGFIATCANDVVELLKRLDWKP